MDIAYKPEIVTSENGDKAFLVTRIQDDKEHVEFDVIELTNGIEFANRTTIKTLLNDDDFDIELAVTNGGRLLAYVINHARTKEAQENNIPSKRLFRIYEGQNSEIPIKNDEGSFISCSLNTIHEERILSAETSFSNGMRILMSVINVEKRGKECIEDFRSFPLSFNELSKFMSKKRYDGMLERVKLGQGIRLNIKDYGTCFSEGNFYFTFRRITYPTTEIVSFESFTVAKLPYGNPNEGIELAYFPAHSFVDDDLGWLTANGKPYFFQVQAAHDRSKALSSTQEPDRFKVYSKKFSFDLTEVDFTNPLNYKSITLGNNESLGKLEPQINSMLKSESKLMIYSGKKSSMGYLGNQAYLFYTADFLR